MNEDRKDAKTQSLLKFRCWNSIKQDFAYFDTPQFSFRKADGGGMEPFVDFANFDIPTEGGFPLDGWGEVEQFIGLCDRDGADIYAGDICKVQEDGNEYDPGTIHQVKYWDSDEYPAFDFEPNYDDDANGIQSAIFGSSVKIISNIHENPELLEVPA